MNDMPDELRDLLAAMSGDSREDHSLSHEEVIDRLRQVAKRFHAGCQFQVGDVVTVRDDGGLRSKGEPQVIIGINHDGYDKGATECGEWSSACVFDVQLLRCAGPDADVVPSLAPYWMLEPFYKS